jgi:hypothetical protein
VHSSEPNRTNERHIRSGVGVPPHSRLINDPRVSAASVR